MQVKLPFSERYSARLSAISFPLEPGGLTSTIRLTKSNADVKYYKLGVITFGRLELLNHVLDRVCGLVCDQRFHHLFENLVQFLLLAVFLQTPLVL